MGALTTRPRRSWALILDSYLKKLFTVFQFMCFYRMTDSWNDKFLYLLPNSASSFRVNFDVALVDQLEETFRQFLLQVRMKLDLHVRGMRRRWVNERRNEGRKESQSSSRSNLVPSQVRSQVESSSMSNHPVSRWTMFHVKLSSRSSQISSQIIESHVKSISMSNQVPWQIKRTTNQYDHDLVEKILDFWLKPSFSYAISTRGPFAAVHPIVNSRIDPHTVT